MTFHNTNTGERWSTTRRFKPKMGHLIDLRSHAGWFCQGHRMRVVDFRNGQWRLIHVI